MSGFDGLWVDDTAPFPDDTHEWTRARTLYEAMIKCELIPFACISISPNMTMKVGHTVVCSKDFAEWLEENKVTAEVEFHK